MGFCRLGRGIVRERADQRGVGKLASGGHGSLRKGSCYRRMGDHMEEGLVPKEERFSVAASLTETLLVVKLWRLR